VGCRQGNSTWVAQGQKSPVFIHKANYLHAKLLSDVAEKKVHHTILKSGHRSATIRRNVMDSDPAR
jgi:hypothetical protein